MKKATSSAHNSITQRFASRPPLYRTVWQKCFMCTSHVFTHNIKKMCTQGLRFNKINYITALSRMSLSEADIVFFKVFFYCGCSLVWIPWILPQLEATSEFRQRVLRFCPIIAFAPSVEMSKKWKGQMTSNVIMKIVLPPDPSPLSGLGDLQGPVDHTWRTNPPSAHLDGWDIDMKYMNFIDRFCFPPTFPPWMHKRKYQRQERLFDKYWTHINLSSVCVYKNSQRHSRGDKIRHGNKTTRGQLRSNAGWSTRLERAEGYRM